MNQPPPYSPLDRPAQFLKGVGPRRADSFARLGIHTARDMLYHVPRRYEDASTIAPIVSAQVGSDVTVIGEVISKGVIPTRSGLRVFQAVLRDASGSIECAWPGQPFLDRTIRKGDVLLVAGTVRFFHGRQIQPREFVPLGTAEQGVDLAGRVLPIYGATEGLSQRMIRGIVESNLPTLLREVAAEEIFSKRQLQAARVPELQLALRMLHAPQSIEEAATGLRRLAYEEQFFLQLLSARVHYVNAEADAGFAYQRSDALIGALYRKLPFQLTGAQARVLREIFADMAASARMNRLLQGDVGSGKTVVALFAMLLAAENGRQSALMAPTEILAEQHARTLERLLEGLPVEVVLLTGHLPANERRSALRRIENGAAIVVGTHALIQEHVQFRDLGLAIVDEQHRFGVRQRMALAELGSRPDVLVMSATPIPRTLALTIYGDLDLSTLDELPPGRQAVRTAIRSDRTRERVYDFVREEVGKGRQAYIVYPLVAESEKVDLKSATEEYERLASQVFPDLRIGLIHGQLQADAKDRTMRAFVAGEIDVLVSTTVIEVGIDVPNATVMVIEHAERFGLSQLHQLRGRIGRGAEESFCVLISEAGERNDRLRVFARTTDGFEIAEADLRIRGMGDFFGARQHGVPELRFFDPFQHADLLQHARDEARSMVARDPALVRPENARVKSILLARYGERARMYFVG